MVHNKLASSNEKASHRAGESICKIYSCQWAQTQNIKRTSKNQNFKDRNTARDINRQFTKEVQMTSKHTEKGSTLLVIRGVQRKPTIRIRQWING